jgi:hypothetical protein
MVQRKGPESKGDAAWKDILRGLDSVLAFARSLKLQKQVATSRFLNYHRPRLVDLTASPSGRARSIELADMIALAEAAELAGIDPFLRQADPQILRRKLRYVLEGPALPSDETPSSNQPRNILFELNTASKLFFARVTPTLLPDRPDLSCTIDGTPLFIECKRVLTEGGAKRRLSDAFAKLESESTKDRPSTRGVVAISIAKLLLQEGEHFLTAPNRAAIPRGLGELIDEKADLLKASWARYGTKVIGVLFHVIIPAVQSDRNVLGVVEQTHSRELAPQKSRDWRTFQRLCARLEARNTDQPPSRA